MHRHIDSARQGCSAAALHHEQWGAFEIMQYCACNVCGNEGAHETETGTRMSSRAKRKQMLTVAASSIMLGMWACRRKSMPLETPT